MPQTHHNIQSGEYFEYYDVFEAILQGFITIGWFNEIEIPQLEEKTVTNLLKELSKLNYSNYIEFNSEWFYDFDWDDIKIKNFKKHDIFKAKTDIDLMIVLGTYAVDVLIKNKLITKPVIADAISDPVGSGIIPWIEDSGNDFLSVRCDPDVYIRQIRLFYDVVKFATLGIIYEDTDNGRSYGATSDIELIAKEKDFEIISDTKVMAEPSETDLKKAQKMYLAALQRVCSKVDAIYLSVCGGLEDENIPEVIKIINKYKIPSFAMEGSVLVKKGVMLGISGSELKSAGIYNVKKIIHIFGGKKPRELSQLFENIPSIAINLKSASNIEYDVPVDIISSSDEIYNTIE